MRFQIQSTQWEGEPSIEVGCYSLVSGCADSLLRGRGGQSDQSHLEKCFSVKWNGPIFFSRALKLIAGQ